MPYFAVIARDKPDSAQLRRDTRTAHLAFLNGLGSAVCTAGPLLAGETPIGSLLIISGESAQAVGVTMSEDPYAAAGLFASVEILPWVPVVGHKFGD